ncbi:HAD family hydrolase [Pseudomonas coleopterorum]|uniref:HAD family hydrolase n=1 Tax=Pseudomonas coleopterorum TaxID=1605838 RepID=A0ABR9C2V1_9PSED|nr:HAD family hydrolase [Pseudomonas coleopterorum]MBD8755684.1 HAD family hydrolase [Pseudomonas coleopterorum]MBD8771664.1 HAD family hydrolase [Pseudomonas coleopterorum]
MVSGVIFDAFGTVVRIGIRTSPYRELLKHGRRQGMSFDPAALHIAMTTNLSFLELASHLGISLSRSKRDELIQALDVELSSIAPFPDALVAIKQLNEAGLKVGICSNVASPYVPIVRGFFPDMDGYAFSCELGVMKPNPAMYRSICSQMAVEPGYSFDLEAGRIVMIGDSKRCDRDGPRTIGISGFHLGRTEHGQIRNLTQFAQIVINQ